MGKSVVNIILGRLRIDGLSVKAGAEKNGFKQDTVYKTIYGTRGKAGRGVSLEIKEALQEASYWPEDEEQGEAANF